MLKELLVIVFISYASIFAMEEREKPEIIDPAKVSNYLDKLPHEIREKIEKILEVVDPGFKTGRLPGEFEVLPLELAFKILHSLAEAPTIIESVKPLIQARLISKKFNELINDPVFVNDLIRYLARKFDIHPIFIAVTLSTPGAIDWLNLELQDKNKLKITAPFYNSPLYWAAYTGNMPMVQLLISKGADVNYTPEGKDTPLMGAAQKGHKAIVEYLIAKGANIHAKNGLRLSALSLARRNKHTEIEDLLRKHGAK